LIYLPPLIEIITQGFRASQIALLALYLRLTADFPAIFQRAEAKEKRAALLLGHSP
jgi:hypothetical protein